MTSNEKMLSADNAVTKDSLTYSDLMKFEDNDFGNAQRFLEFAGGKAFYDSPSSNWFLYDSGRWKPDNDGKERVHKLANDLYSFLLDGLKEEYHDLEEYGIDILKGTARDIDTTDLDEDELNQIRVLLGRCIRERQVILKLGNHSHQNRVLKSAEAQKVDDVIELNPYNHYLVVANGTVDLRTGKLLDHSQEHFSTMRASVAYNPKAEEPTEFLKFLGEIFLGNVSMVNYVHRLLGYCLTGETKEHEFYILHGSGGNGKSVLIDLIKAILSEYCGEVSGGALARSADGDKPNPTILQAKDCRILISNESEKDARLNTTLIKQISAGNEICPRTLHKVNKHFKPHMKILCVTNHIPQLDWNDGGMDRRIRLIPFPLKVPKEKANLKLPEILLEEKEDVLKWLVDGAIAYYNEGLADIPDVMQEAMDHEKFGADSISYFFNKAVIPTGEDADRRKAKEVYVAYKQFCMDHDVALPETETMFGRRFQALCKGKSISHIKHSDGMYYHGLKLLSLYADDIKVVA